MKTNLINRWNGAWSVAIATVVMSSTAAFGQFFPTGACCFTDGECSVVDYITCLQGGGVYHGNNSSCSQVACTGACCDSFSGMCSETSPLNCQISQGAFHGLGSTCQQVGDRCTGACCFPDGSCEQSTSATCPMIGGEFRGLRTACEDVNCFGACCMADGSCQLLSEDECAAASGMFTSGAYCDEVVCPLPTDFTYQGSLKMNGSAYTGSADLSFTLWNNTVGGTELQGPVVFEDVPVTDGLFTVMVDFGVDVFNGQGSWIEVAVREGADTGPFTPLSPRQRLTAVPYALQTRGLFVNDGGNVGVGTSNPAARLDVAGTVRMSAMQLTQGAAAGKVLTCNASGVGTWQTPAGAWTSASGGIHYTSGSVGIGTSAPAATLDVNGTTRTSILEITGGSDIAEPYRIAAAGGTAAAPGMVVVIDPDRTGQLRVSSAAYDRTVAGIISGANGVRPGLTLTQEGTAAHGDLPVANVGRVWCLCDADANGAIRAGDLLTTSGTPGHAMKVTAHEKANGAIIGKAMSSLEQGRGMVLVLVSLQ